MSPWEAFFVGIAPQHVAAMAAAALVPVLIFVVPGLRSPMGTGAGQAPLDPVRRWAAGLLAVTAAVHLALPFGHADPPGLAIGFVIAGAGYTWLAARAVRGGPWRLLSSLLLVATLTGYLAVAGSGQEEPDQVGIATALVELAALGLCLVPSREPGRPRRLGRFFGSAGTLAATLIVGASIWVGSFLAHTAAEGGAPSTGDGEAAMGAVGHAGDTEHEHDHAARAQAGVVMRPLADHRPTVAQQRAADRVAAATRAATRRYASLDAALAAGYVLPRPGRGPDVHLEHKGFKSDGRVLDPQRPEMLVYAIDDTRATLLGVVFVMERGGVPGPEPGGPITRWHAHNICLTVLPPGFGIVTPFGSCPALSVAVTSPEMMHVWVVDNPQGPFAEGLEEQWVWAYHATNGRPR